MGSQSLSGCVRPKRCLERSHSREQISNCCFLAGFYGFYGFHASLNLDDLLDTHDNNMRERHCRKCGANHAPPTGKKCTFRPETDEFQTTISNVAATEKLQEFSDQFTEKLTVMQAQMEILQKQLQDKVVKASSASDNVNFENQKLTSLDEAQGSGITHTSVAAVLDLEKISKIQDKDIENGQKLRSANNVNANTINEVSGSAPNNNIQSETDFVVDAGVLESLPRFQNSLAMEREVTDLDMFVKNNQQDGDFMRLPVGQQNGQHLAGEVCKQTRQDVYVHQDNYVGDQMAGRGFPQSFATTKPLPREDELAGRGYPRPHTDMIAHVTGREFPQSWATRQPSGDTDDHVTGRGYPQSYATRQPSREAEMAGRGYPRPVTDTDTQMTGRGCPQSFMGYSSSAAERQATGVSVKNNIPGQGQFGGVTTSMHGQNMQNNDVNNSNIYNTTRDNAVPLLPALRADTQLAHQVARRMNELGLEDDYCDGFIANSNRRGKKSGQSRTAEDTIVRDVDWPHFYVFRGQDRKAVKFLELTLPEFVMGFLCMLANQRNGMDRDLMLPILKDMMVDTIVYGWPQIRGYYKMLACGVEQARYDWVHTAEIASIRAQYAQTMTVPVLQNSRVANNRPFSQNFRPRSDQNQMKLCVPYQTGECRFDDTHDNCAHACAYCYNAVGFFYNHKEKECKRKFFASKN